MKRVTVIYGPPADSVAFDKYYAEVHSKLARKMPHLVRFQYSTGPVASSDVDRPAHLIAFLDYANQADLDASLGSPEGKAAVDDLANFASGGVTILTVDLNEI